MQFVWLGRTSATGGSLARAAAQQPPLVWLPCNRLPGTCAVNFPQHSIPLLLLVEATIRVSVEWMLGILLPMGSRCRAWCSAHSTTPLSVLRRVLVHSQWAICAAMSVQHEARPLRILRDPVLMLLGVGSVA